ncbi:hypothetical protein K469DRAFT_697147 [Zopfia rhizophila CBS 207.26]|uniref:Uncharacterized protein n=1 Tax=Zopfia rhizophila CBS 207.26 TaxID=1314779 RepID=A0A6A6EL89_9PEZI|nr:hypothetical protein K469DRAFT_697147 [Zopfia rhizophila CBS 207.26]
MMNYTYVRTLPYQRPTSVATNAPTKETAKATTNDSINAPTNTLTNAPTHPPTSLSVFSKVKKAKKAAENQKKAAVQVQEMKPPPVQYMHIPTHALQDALSATPPTFTPEEHRAKVAAARKRIISEMSAPASGSRASSDTGIHPGAHVYQSDLSIDSVMNKSQPQSYQPEFQNDDHAYSHPREVPLPPPRRSRPYYGNFVTISSPMALKRPLSTIVTEEPEDTSSHSSQNSTCSTVSTPASSIKSTPSRSNSRKEPLKPPKLLESPKPPVSKPQEKSPSLDISRPYSSNGESTTASSKIPTWRYEDFSTNTKTPTMVPSVSPKFLIKGRVRSVLHKKQNSAPAVTYSLA